ncbi:transposase [Streptomyces albidoflavus]|nr:transposase [Streptomyces albidoflavus]
MNRFQCVADLQRRHGVKRLCSILGVARSSFCYWRRTAADRAARQTADAQLCAQIRAVHLESDGTYGAPRITAELRESSGEAVNHKRVARIMRASGIEGVRLRRRHRTTVSDPAAAKAPDLIGRDFTADRPNTKYVGDITYLPIEGGRFCYLATVIDLASRRLVGWAIADHMRADLVTDALTAAVRTRGSLAGSIMHTDHGAQYTSRIFAEACRSAGVRRSMSAVGSSADNALAESFNATFKRETLKGQRAGRPSARPDSTPSDGSTPTTPDADTPASDNDHRSPSRTLTTAHQLRWRKPHNPCSGFGVKARRGTQSVAVLRSGVADAGAVQRDPRSPPEERAVVRGSREDRRIWQGHQSSGEVHRSLRPRLRGSAPGGRQPHQRRHKRIRRQTQSRGSPAQSGPPGPRRHGRLGPPHPRRAPRRLQAGTPRWPSAQCVLPDQLRRADPAGRPATQRARR